MALTNLQRLRLNVVDPYREFQDSQLGDGSSIHFRLSSYPVLAASEQVYIAGVLKADPADYSLDDDSGKVTFVSAPTDGATIFVRGEASVFSDAECNDVLTQQGDDVRLSTLHVLRILMADKAKQDYWTANQVEVDPRQTVSNLKTLYDAWLSDAQRAAIDSGGVEEWAVEQQYYT